MSSVINRARESQWPRIPMSEAYEIVEKAMEATDAQTVPVWNVKIGDVLAEDVISPVDVPEVQTSIKDGYAVIASDTPGLRKVLGSSTAGGPSLGKLKTGECIRISTGAPLPNGADAVAMVENTKLVEHDGKEELIVDIQSAVKVGQDIRFPGSDVRKGDLLLGAHSRIGSSEIGILMGSGHDLVKIFNRPKCAVMSTGNEVVDAMARHLPVGHARDTNRPQLLALCQQAGATTVDMGIIPDDRPTLVNAISSALCVSDVLVSSGGVSMGEKDLLKTVLQEDFGFKIHFGRVLMKPGLPTTFASGQFRGQQKWIFALPGNPVSSFVCAELFVTPAIRKRAGDQKVWHTAINVKISREVHLDSRPEFRRAYISETNDSIPTVVTTGNQISSRILSLKGANLLLELPAKTEEVSTLPAGTVVKGLVIQML